MKLSDYFARIDYRGPATPDLNCLAAIHRQHLLKIPYENLDVQLGQSVDLDPERIFDKLVFRRRGGWCYEMNGLLGWALEEIGFDVTRMAGGVMRSHLGDSTLGNHLVLAVRLEKTYIADVGLGNGLIEPTPLVEGSFSQGFRQFRLEKMADGLWRFHNFPSALPADFDFRDEAADEYLFESTCRELQTDPESMFVQNLICERLHEEGVRFLLGKTLFTFSGLESTQRILDSEEDLAETLSTIFSLDGIDVGRLWSRVVARHQELFGNKSAAEISLDGS